MDQKQLSEQFKPVARPKNPWLAAGLSFLLPGSGHLYLRDYSKGVVFLSIDAGIFLSLFYSRFAMTRAALFAAYLFVWFPVLLDAYRSAAGFSGGWKNDTAGYVILMLLFVGPFALPLLWQSQKFSRPAKTIWSLAVIGIALLFIGTMTVLGDFFNALLTSAEGA